MFLRPTFVSFVAGLGLFAAGSVHAAILAGNLSITQNNVGNSASSVSGEFTYKQGDISYSSGNRGDFGIRFGNATAAEDVANGIMIASISQNGRSNEGPVSGSTPAIGAGPGYATPSIQQVSGGYGSAIFVGATNVSGATAGDEWNANHAVGYFNYNDFLGGWITNGSTNNGVMTTLPSSSFGLTLSSGTENTAGSHIFDSTANNGAYNVNLSSFNAPGSGLPATSQNGIMLVVGGKNEANHALSKANADGSFDVLVRSSDTGNRENDGAAFVYIPTGQEGVAAMGRVDGDANVEANSGDFTVTKGTTGQWLISTTGLDPSNSVLLVSPEGGTTYNSDNIVSYEYDYERQLWVVESRDIPDLTTSNPGLQNLPGEWAFSFALISNVPEPSTAFLGLIGLSVMILRRRK